MLALGGRVDGLKLGFDPSDLPEAQGLKSAEDFADFTRFTLATAPEASIIYLEYRLVLASLASGYDMVAGLHAGGKTVDAWTFDVTSPDRSDRSRQADRERHRPDLVERFRCLADGGWKRLNFGTSRSPAVPPVAAILAFGMRETPCRFRWYVAEQGRFRHAAPLHRELPGPSW